MPELSYQGIERRRFPRIPFWYIVRYKVYMPAKDQHSGSFTSRSKNISLGGILLETNHYYAAGTVLEVEIDVPLDMENHVYAKVLGRVIRSANLGDDKSFDSAIEFISLPQEYRTNILRLINAFL